MAKTIPKRKETPAFHLSSQLGTVQVFRPKNSVTIVTDVDDIDVCDGSLLLLKRAGNGRIDVCAKAKREFPGPSAARFHHAPRRRGMAARSGRAAGQPR